MAKAEGVTLRCIPIKNKTRVLTSINPYMFDDFCDTVDTSSNKTVFTQFYEWLEKEFGLVDNNSMHGRCRVSSAVNDRLRKLEGKRIRKVHKVKGAEAAHALFMSDTGSGPCVVDGFSIYVDEDQSHTAQW
jgi:hypothetical protein